MISLFACYHFRHTFTCNGWQKHHTHNKTHFQECLFEMGCILYKWNIRNMSSDDDFDATNTCSYLHQNWLLCFSLSILKIYEHVWTCLPMFVCSLLLPFSHLHTLTENTPRHHRPWISHKCVFNWKIYPFPRIHNNHGISIAIAHSAFGFTCNRCQSVQRWMCMLCYLLAFLRY